MSLTSKEEAIKLFIKDGWLSNATDHPGYYSLGVSFSLMQAPLPTIGSQSLPTCPVGSFYDLTI